MKKIILIAAFLILVLKNVLIAQVSVNPPVVFIDPDKYSASISVRNSSEDFREMETTFKFGYHAYDSLGNPTINWDDTTTAEKYSLAPYIKAYPTKIVLPPNEMQTVRFMVRNFRDLPDGTYWTRFIARSNPIVEQVDTTKKDGITANIIIATELVGLAVFQKGVVNAGLDITYERCFLDTSMVNLLMKCDKSGNSPFWGTLVLEVFNSDEEKVAESEQGLAIYFDCRMKVQIPQSDLKPGKYRAKLFVNNEREAIAPEFRTDFKTITQEFELIVPSQ